MRNAGPNFAEYGSRKRRARLRKYSRTWATYGMGPGDGRRAPQMEDSFPLAWEKECERFFAALKKFDDYLASEKPLQVSAEKLFQGPIADALTHIGQMAMLRRMAGVPMKGENYFVAEVTVGRVGEDQAHPRKSSISDLRSSPVVLHLQEQRRANCKRRTAY